MYTHGQIQMFSTVLHFWLMQLLAKPIAARLKAFEECLLIVPFNVQCNISLLIMRRETFNLICLFWSLLCLRLQGVVTILATAQEGRFNIASQQGVGLQ